MKPRRTRPRRLARWVGTGAVAAALPLALVASQPAVLTAAGDGHRTPAGGWASGLWMSAGTATSATGTTLKDVRTIINAASGTAASLTGQGVGIALIDTGVAPVPGLPKAQVVNGPDLSFESQAANLRYLDSYGHGTHMAGIMIANDTATGTVGLAPKSKVTSIKVGTSNGAVDVTQVIAAIDWVVKNKNHDSAAPIRVLNLSYGSGGNAPSWTDPLQFAVEQAWKAGIVVVVAAGNFCNNTGRLTNPATDPLAIAVGSSNPKGTLATGDDELSTFTNQNMQEKGLDLLAPGESIVSLRDEGANIDETYPTARVGTTLFKGTGTSQSAAVVSAAAAMLLQNRPSLTPDQVKKILFDSGTHIMQGVGASRGYRQLNVGRALTTATPAYTQTWANSGDGTIQTARGTSAVVRDNVALTGEKSIFGAWSSSGWAAKAAAKTSWSGGVWMGYRMAADGWTGTSFASKTWGSATWSGKPWSGASSWVDPDWSGRYWSGRYWSGRYWSGRYWSSDDWSAAYWG